ncbi:MAG: cytochrome c oxidase subunit II [Rhodothermales bacterium]
MFDWLDLSPLLGMPEAASAHSAQVDALMGLVHWLMIILFVIWAPFFLYTLYRFRASKNPKADYFGVHSHLSTYQEVGVVVAELVLLFGFAVPTWAALRAEANYPTEEESTVVHVIGEQFAWNVHYPGPDGEFGERDIELIDLQTNPIGLRPDDPAGADDIVTVNELHVPVDRPVIVHLTSKDVIHSFSLAEMRVKQDAIPGLSIPLYFTPTSTGDWEISCAQLCGVGHYRMRGYFTVHSEADFQAWLDEQSAGPGA